MWLHLVGDGIRALALAGRWDDAVTHAHAHRGIGLHLMEGRQATIVAHCLNEAPAAGRAALAESTPIQPWELQVASCLKVLCTDAAKPPMNRDITAMIERFTDQEPMPGYAAYRAQLGLTVTTLAGPTAPKMASRVLSRTVEEVVKAGDRYAARDVLRYRRTHGGLTSGQITALSSLLASSGLGTGTLPKSLLHSLLSSARTAVDVLNTAIPQSDHSAQGM